MTNLEAEPTLETLISGEVCTSVEVLESRPVPLGGIRAMTVHRTLPSKKRSLIGAWCFVDHYGPDRVAQTGGMQVPRHPHTGLATVSWLFSGHIDHLDSGGNAAAVVPGQLNLMIAGSGITHQELSDPASPELYGVQLWYALPDATRFTENAFVHYEPSPLAVDGATIRVFIGELLGEHAGVDTRTPELLGVEVIIDAHATLTLPVQADFEFGILAESAAVMVNGMPVEHRALGYIPVGADTITISAGSASTRVLLLGGVPLNEEIVMWWNFIGRSHEEIAEFRRRYQGELGFAPVDARDVGKPPLFGTFPDGQPDPLPAPPMPNTRLLPRG